MIMGLLKVKYKPGVRSLENITNCMIKSLLKVKV